MTVGEDLARVEGVIVWTFSKVSALAQNRRIQSLFRDLVIARADGSLRSLRDRLSRVNVVVIDDWVMAPLFGA
jgi:hypothetical protein